MRKIIIVGVTAAAILGTGTAALAVTGDPTAPSGTTGSQQQPPGQPGGPMGNGGPGQGNGPGQGHGPADGPRGHRGGQGMMKNAEHGEVVMQDKDGGFVTHEFARGVVAEVSANLIVVHTEDGTNQKFTVTSDTAVRLRSDGKGEPGKITDVHLGDHVLVAGTGTGTPVAKHVVDTGTS